MPRQPLDPGASPPMTPERWEAVKRLFQEALEREPAERAGYLADAAKTDPALADEIRALLSIQGQADEAFGGLTRTAGLKTLAPGTRLGPYEIVSLVGAGGMGEVYKARDTRLDRTVAVKVLPSGVAADPYLRERFEREARTISKLSHPHICPLYDVGEQDGVTFLVMEYLEGENLADRLRKSLLPLPEALQYATEIARALAEAHRRGIVHRDLKPANVMLTASGAKLLDFGIAKLRPGAVSEEAPTATAAALTGEGAILGTAAYMSPEQALGKPVDVRSDVFSLGAVLYEMFTGQRAFKGDSPLSVLMAIVQETPAAPKTLRSDIPDEVQRIVLRCLEKHRQARYSSAVELSEAIHSLRSRLAAPSVRAILLRPRTAIPALVMLSILIGGGTWWWMRGSGERWARNTALPEIVRLIDEGDTHTAFRLIRQAEKHIPGDPQIERLVREHGGRGRYRTAPAGAEVYVKSYGATNELWELLGKTPLEGIPAARGFYRFRVVKPGYEEVETSSQVWGAPLTLAAKGTAPPGMVLVTGGGIALGNTTLKLDDYWLDRYEVTNNQYRTFVDQGGYREKQHWKHPFVKDGRTLSWDEAMALFRDTTGRHGPATWELGTYPEGRGDDPVGGLSWYEAAAYAEFAGKSLPTVYHWRRVAGDHTWADIAEHSNYLKRGPARVGSFPGVALFGPYDLAGNVREWCWNQTGERRYALGGSWNDPVYAFQKLVSQPAFDRDEGNGVRLAKYIASPSAVATAALPEEAPRNYTVERAVPDAIFRAYESLYSYDRTDLRAKIESVEESEEYRKEKVSFDAAYGNERMSAYLFLPKNASAPYQTVVYFPSMGAFVTRSSDRLELFAMAFWLRSGRAVMYPVYKGAYERSAPLPDERTSAHRDLMIQWAKDVGRSIDYLESRADIDRERLAYSGASYGTMWGPVMVHAGARFKAAVWLFGGLRPHPVPPEADPLNFLPRLKIPVIMINGRNDYLCNQVESQLPMFRSLGTAEKDKKHVMLDGGHVPTRISEVYRHALDWLDKYLGPVRR